MQTRSTSRKELIHEVENAIERSPNKSDSGRYAVYVPGAVVIGTYDKDSQAHAVALKWTKIVRDVVVVDRIPFPASDE